MRRHFLIFTVLACSLLPTPAAVIAQETGSVTRRSRTSAATARPMSAEVREAAERTLARLRVLRNCWSDPYMVIASDDPRFENDSLYLRCGRDYQLRLVEAREAVGRALTTISNPTLRREVSAAMEVFNDLDKLHQLFNRRDYFFRDTVRVSDIYPIVRRYNIPYQEDSISKVAVYRAVTPARRTHIDRLAALIPGAPRDDNPTLTPEQEATAADDFAWSIAEQQGEGYDWYLRRHPQGRHAAEARRMLNELDTARSEQNARLAAIRDELTAIVRETVKAYISGDRAAFERLLAPEFPNRADYISSLGPQPEVLSFEIRNLTVQAVPQQPEHYLAFVRVLYYGNGGQRREYDNRITYAKNDGHWQIIKWQSP